MQANKRGKNVALGGLALQTVLAAMTWALWWNAQIPPAAAGFWLALAPVAVWLLSVILFYCRFLARREEQELEELSARGGDRASIFADDQVRPAASRLRWMEKFLVPAFTLLLAAYNVLQGLMLLRAARQPLGPLPQGLTTWMFVCVGLAFAAFMFSRYTTGMAKLPAWRLLRAPGSYLFTNALVFLLLAAELACEQYESHLLTVLLAYLLPVFMLLLGAEALLNFVLDLYRPRMPGAEQRFSYDSRLLSLIASPESIGHSIAEALNYQFGFEVSSTWFYKLLQRSLVPLILAGTAIIWLLSSVVIVEEGQQVMLLRWGQPHPRRVLTSRPMPYLIWPWPAESIRRFNTAALHEVQLGVGELRENSKEIQRRTYLWSEEHGPRQELDTLVALPPRRTAAAAPASRPASPADASRPVATTQESTSQPAGGRIESKPPPYYFVKLVVSVQYRITDPYKFHYTHTDAARCLKDVAYRELVKYAASATLDEPLPPDQAKDRPAGIMSFGRAAMTAELQRRIARAVRQTAGGEGLGLEITRVQLLACHPPKEAAEAFESVAAAEREREQKRYAAETEANKVLAECAGDPALAWTLNQALNFRADLDVLLRCPDPKAMAGELLKQAQDQAGKLRSEIEKERLLGRLATGRQTCNQELLERQLRHLGLLEAVQAGSAGVKLPEELTAVEQRVEELFAQAQGKAAVEVAAARAERWTTEFRERGRAENFDVELQSYRAAPSLYRLEKYLEALSEGIRDARKYVLGVERDQIELRLNLEQKGQSWQSIAPSSK